MSAPRARFAGIAPALAALLAAGLTCAFAPLAPQTVAEIARPDFIAEALAVAPTGDLLVSGVGGRTILQLTPSGARAWLKGRAAGGLFGMATDVRRDRLWVAETA